VEVLVRRFSKHLFYGSHWLPRRWLVVPFSGENVNYYDWSTTIVALTMVSILNHGHWQSRIAEKMLIITNGLIP
jgi:hypothetical protein